MLKCGSQPKKCDSRPFDPRLSKVLAASSVKYLAAKQIKLPRPEPSLISTSLRPGRELAAQLAEEQHGIRPPNVAWA